MDAAMKLFSSKAYRACKNCLLGRATAGGQHVLCARKGVVDADFCCRKYRYDPLKRVPRSAPKLPPMSEDDFKL